MQYICYQEASFGFYGNGYPILSQVFTDIIDDDISGQWPLVVNGLTHTVEWILQNSLGLNDGIGQQVGTVSKIDGELGSEEMNMVIIDWIPSIEAYFNSDTPPIDDTLVIRAFADAFPGVISALKKENGNNSTLLQKKSRYKVKSTNDVLKIDILQRIIQAILPDSALLRQGNDIYSTDVLLQKIYTYFQDEKADLLPIHKNPPSHNILGRSFVQITMSPDTAYFIYLFEPRARINRSTSDLEEINARIKELYSEFLGIREIVTRGNTKGFDVQGPYEALVNRLIKLAISQGILEPMIKDYQHIELPMYVSIDRFEELYKMISSTIENTKKSNASINNRK